MKQFLFRVQILEWFQFETFARVQNYFSVLGYANFKIDLYDIVIIIII